MHAVRRPDLNKAIEQMPKVELHVHLEGSISSETIVNLAQKNGIDVGIEKLNPTRLRYGHLINFLDAYRMRCQSLRSADDFETACIDVLENLRAQRVRYAEIMISPTMHRLNGHAMAEIMPGIEAGARRVCGKGGLQVRFIFDVGRQFGSEHAWQTVREAASLQEFGVIAVGLGGDEIHYAPEIFVEQFQFARKEGLHLIAHAGEVSGPPSVWGAVKALGAERIGHGLGARGDELLLEHLRIQKIGVDMCPTSNLHTGAVRSYADHPLPGYLRRGLLVTLNSDDPAMFGTTLTEEYKVAYEELGLEWEELKRLSMNGVKASFLPDMDKQELLEQFADSLEDIELEMRIH